MKKQRTVQKHNNTGTVILTIILIALLLFATYFVAVNYETVKATFNGTKLYTQKEVTEAYNRGVEDKESYESQISDWMTKYETIESGKLVLEEKVTANEEEIKQLKNENEQLKELQEKEGEDYSLEILKKNAEIERLTAENNQLTAEIKELQKQLAQVKREFNEYELIINSLAGKGNYLILYIDNAEIKSIKVKQGEALGTQLPKLSEGYIYWYSLYGNEKIHNEEIEAFVPTRHMYLSKEVADSTTHI